MKLGEALNERARLAKEIAENRDLLGHSVVMLEGEAPPTDPISLLEKIVAATHEVAELQYRINQTNHETNIGDVLVQPDMNISITEAIAQRDKLSSLISLYDFLIRKLSGQDKAFYARRSASELKEERMMSTDDLMDEKDRLARDRRELDAALQATNWTVELI